MHIGGRKEIEMEEALFPVGTEAPISESAWNKAVSRVVDILQYPIRNPLITLGGLLVLGGVAIGGKQLYSTVTRTQPQYVEKKSESPVIAPTAEIRVLPTPADVSVQKMPTV